MRHRRLLGSLVLLGVVVDGVLGSAPTNAGPAPYLVRDIATGGVGVGATHLVRAGDLLFFAGDDGVHGVELWRSDGTSAGTTLVAEVAPGPGDGNLEELTPVGGALYFIAREPGAQRSLWRSDGTAVGTVRISPPFRQIHSLRDVGGTVYFLAAATGAGESLWRTDPDAGVVALNDPDAPPFFAGTFELAAVGSTCFLAGTDPVNGRELWKSDGGPPELVVDLYPGDAWADPTQLAAVGSRLFFVASAPEGYGLYATDGSATGTVRLLDGFGISLFGTLDDVAFLSRGGELWRSDGTLDGTRLVAAPGAGWYAGGRTAVLGDTLFFTGFDPLHGSELWRTDGTAQGTGLVVDLSPGTRGSDTRWLVTLGEQLFFVADDPLAGTTIWRSDGTAEGTVPVADLHPTAYAQETPADLTALRGTLFFTGDDGRTGVELWRSDGTTAGTTLVRDVLPRTDDAQPQGLLAVGGRLLFSAHDGGPAVLWTSDGTAAGTTPVSEVSLQSGLVVAPDGVMFLGDRGGTTQLWRSDGSVAGTRRLTNFPRGFFDLNCAAVIGGSLFFTGFDESAGSEPWRSDGTAAGTARIADIAPGPSGSFPCGFTDVGGLAVFSAFDSDEGFELWRTDGTGPGTVRVRVLVPGHSGGAPTNFSRIGDKVYFTAQSGEDEEDGLWTTDGTRDGTVKVASLRFEHTDLVQHLGRFFFAAYAPDAGTELWVVDPTSGGAPVMVDLNPGNASSFPNGFTEVGGVVFFSAQDAEAGRELWRTDGTAAGTHRVKDIRPGAPGSAPRELADGGGRLFFTADDGATGAEVWRSDGTAGGTVLVADLEPGKPASTPASFTRVGDLLYFSATTSGTGRELWALPVGCGDGLPDEGEACDDGNRTSGDGCSATCTHECLSDAECTDGLSCTDDRCVAGVCVQAERSGYAGVRCHVAELTALPECTGQMVDPTDRVGGLVAAGQAALDRAEAAPTARAMGRQLRRADRKLVALRQLVARLARKKKAPPACAAAMADAVESRRRLIAGLRT